MEEKASWIKTKPAEVEKLILDLASKNISPEKIGLILRDEHGIPKTRIITKKKICEILKENKIETSPEKNNIEKKIDNLKKHSEINKHDYTAKRRLVQRIGQLRKYK